MIIRASGNGSDYSRKFSVTHIDISVGKEGIEAVLEKVRKKMQVEGCHQAHVEITMNDQEYSHFLEGCTMSGQMEAWDLARRIMASDTDCYTLKDLDSAFGTTSFPDIFRKPVETALKKDKKYQDELHTFHIGDQVITEDGKGYVVSVAKETVRVLCNGGDCFWYCKNVVKKTGKTDSYLATIMKSLD